MPWIRAGVVTRLQILVVLGMVGGLLLASINMAAAQDTTTVPVTRVTGNYVSDQGLEVDIPASFFPGFGAAGSIEIQSRSLMRGGATVESATIVVERVRLEEDQTASEFLVPNPGKPADTVVEYLGRAVRISVMDGADDITGEVRFNPTMTVNFEVTDSEWALAMGKTDVFIVRVSDPVHSMWRVVETNTNPFDKFAFARVSRGGDLALFREFPAPDGGDIALSSSALALILLGGLMLVGVGVVLVRSSGVSRTR